MRTRVTATEPAGLRADATRNRKAVLEAARVLFSERGLDTGMEDVADRAGVGVGTVYRHFASKAALVDAVFEEILGEVSTIADEALEQPDAWAAFARFVERLASVSAANRGLRGIMRSRVREGGALADAWLVGADRIERLLGRAQAEGAIREDVGLADVRAVLWGAAEVAEIASAAAPGLWQRHLHLVLDGLRAEAATPMPAPPIGRSRARAL